MSKVPLTPISNLQQQTTAVTVINANAVTTTTGFDNTLSLDGTSPNAMGSNLDMNNFQILNLPAPATINSPVRLIDVPSGTGVPISSVPPTGTSGAVVPFLNGNNTWSGTNNLQKRTTISYLPVYDQASGLLSTSLFIPLDTSTHTVLANDQFNHIAIRQSDGGNNKFTVGSNALAEGFTVFMESLAGSD